ncbi:hypothetical protein BU23DRAFT_569405 [Bimuria novae-zelandiae CBS 107.79]|uniref:Uncharacterized protein n=1 Tax=Bimuria novae-zelandiae CBS 107.79 TaxID=1447943 RepID=A0A6A5V831_9PLEO|nr:hypothetical protein BU23DRAFT_569405 [Bimuria novae-zelandiae CBS 107.79]
MLSVLQNSGGMAVQPGSNVNHVRPRIVTDPTFQAWFPTATTPGQLDEDDNGNFQIGMTLEQAILYHHRVTDPPIVDPDQEPRTLYRAAYQGALELKARQTADVARSNGHKRSTRSGASNANSAQINHDDGQVDRPPQANANTGYTDASAPTLEEDSLAYAAFAFPQAQPQHPIDAPEPFFPNRDYVGSNGR